LQAIIFVDGFRQAPSLVGGKGIHGVENDRFNAWFADVLVAIVEDGIEKCLCLPEPVPVVTKVGCGM